MDSALDRETHHPELLPARVLDDIRTGRIPMPSVIQSTSLASRYGVSRAQVRRALAALGREGILNAVPRKGYILPAVQPEEVSDLFTLRRAVESAATSETSARLTDRTVARLLATNPEADDQLCTGGLHLHLTQACGSPRIATLFDSIRRANSRLLGAGLADPRPRDVLREHRAVLHAMLCGDARTAGREMESHLDQIRVRATRLWLEGAHVPAHPQKACTHK